MLSFSSEPGSEELIRDHGKSVTIHHVSDKVVPGIIHDNPMSLLTKQRLFKLKKLFFI